MSETNEENTLRMLKILEVCSKADDETLRKVESILEIKNADE